MRIIVDSRLRLPLTARVVAEAQRVPTWIITLRQGDSLRQETFRACGVELVEVGADEGAGVDMTEALQALGARGLTRILVEGGALLVASLVRNEARRSPRMVPRASPHRRRRRAGRGGVRPRETGHSPAFERTALIGAGEDVLETYRRTT